MGVALLTLDTGRSVELGVLEAVAMAFVELDQLSGKYRIRFRFGGREYKRSLKTASEVSAQAQLARVKETLRFLENGRLEMPDDADPGKFILSDGKLNGKPAAPRIGTLQELFAAVNANLPSGTHEPNTENTEKLHQKHLLRILGERKLLRTLKAEDIQGYVNQRLAEAYRGRKSRRRRSRRKSPR